MAMALKFNYVTISSTQYPSRSGHNKEGWRFLGMFGIVKAAKRVLSRFGKDKYWKTYSLNSLPSKVLDIGIANDSYHECRSVFPQCTYHGVDKFPIDFSLQSSDRFFCLDLEEPGALGEIDRDYDLILVNHVLEHLVNGEEVFRDLCGLLRNGGILYAEYPSIRTAYAKQTGRRYHFHEDPTHVMFHTVEALANIALRSGCKIISCGPCSAPPLKRLISIPRALLNGVIGRGFYRYLPGEISKLDHVLIIKD